MRQLLVGLLFAVLCFGQGASVVYDTLLTDVAAFPTTSPPVTNIGQTGVQFLLHIKDVPLGACPVPMVPSVTFNVYVSYDKAQWFGVRLFDTIRTDSLGTRYITGLMGDPYPYMRVVINDFDTVNCRLDLYATSARSIHIEDVTAVGEWTGRDAWPNTTIGLWREFNGASVLSANALWNYSGNSWDRMLDCNFTKTISAAVNTTTQQIAPSPGDTIKVCSLLMSSGANGNVQFISGTGPTCGTGTTHLSAAMDVLAAMPFSYGSGLGSVWTLPEGDGLCITTTNGANAVGTITFSQYVVVP